MMRKPATRLGTKSPLRILSAKIHLRYLEQTEVAEVEVPVEMTAETVEEQMEVVTRRRNQFVSYPSP